MNNFSWAKAIGYGVSIWLVMFIIAAILVSGMSVALSNGTWLTLAIVAGIVSYLFALGTEAATSAQALGYGLAWAVVGMILDAIISRRFQSNIFGLWEYYFGYALVLLAPWIEYETQGSSAHHKPV
jgi:hypothetical protein